MKYKNIPWQKDDDFKKSIGQFRLQLGGVFEPFNLYGQDIFIPGDIDAVVRLAIDLTLRVRGAPKMISLDSVRKKR